PPSTATTASVSAEITSASRPCRSGSLAYTTRWGIASSCREANTFGFKAIGKLPREQGVSTPEDVDFAVRELMLVFPRLVGRIKKLPPPPAVRSLELTPRHLALLSMLLLDGPLTVSELAERLSVAPTTVSL